MGLLSIGVSGLLTNRTALQTIGNNITNASVDGYSRQRVELATTAERLSGGSYIGTGSIVVGIERIVDQFAVTQLRLDTSSFSGFDAYGKNIEQLDTLLADEFSSLSPALANFFTALEDGVASPTSIPARQLVVSNAEGLVQQMNTLSDRIGNQIIAINDRLASLAASVTGLVEGIAGLNASIEAAIGAGAGAQPNQLLDERERLLKELSSIIGIQTVATGAGTINVFIGSGQPLVIGTTASRLQTQPSESDPRLDDVIFVEAGSGNAQVLDKLNGSGAIGGLVRYRSDVLSEVLNTLGRMAIGIAGEFNAQQANGLDLDGNFGTNIFKDINDWALASSRAIDGKNNTGSAVSIYFDDLSKVTTSDYSLRVDAVVAGVVTEFTLIRNADQMSWDETTVDSFSPKSVVFGEPLATSNIPVIQTADGFSINLEGVSPVPGYAIGDTFVIKPTRNGAQDMSLEIIRPQELAFAAPIVTSANIGNRGTGIVSQGEVINTSQSLFDKTGLALNPPFEVRFTSATTFDLYDSDTGLIVTGSPYTYTQGQSNTLTFNSADADVAASPAEAAANLAAVTVAAGLGGATAASVAAAAVIHADSFPQGSVQEAAARAVANAAVAAANVGGATPASVLAAATVAEAGGQGPLRVETTNVTNDPADAYRFEIQGVPQMNDVFSVSFNSNGVSDNRNALLMGALRFNGTLDGGDINFEGSYSRLVETVGVKTAQARISASAAESLMIQSQNTLSSVSGVNLDEEAANLIKFEQAYSACAQVINVARQIFDMLINAVG